MADVVIASAVRTPTGRFLGVLKGHSAVELGAMVVREAVARAGIDASAVGECVMGNVVSAGLGQNPARQAALRGGLPSGVAAATVNQVCGSGLKAVMLAAQAIRAGDSEIAVAGGMESMSNAPYLLPRVREGLRLGHGQMLDAVIADGLWCAFEDRHMGSLADDLARECGVSREAQDAYAARSHEKAADATARGWFANELVPVPRQTGDKNAGALDRDEPIRADTSRDRLAALKPAFTPGGTVTAGNAPGMSDGAAAVVVMSSSRAEALGVRPLARIVAQATTGIVPRNVLLAPIDTVRLVLAKAGWKMTDVDLFEINEAFSAQMVALVRALELPEDRLNVNGGAVALGHAIGSSGARVLTTLVHALARRDLGRGVAALCLGGGNGVAVAVERRT
jgi:acetyl-CoA C-acetyltransferase